MYKRQEGKGVVAEGYLRDRNFLSAKKILAKHDENYMPPEVADALEKAGANIPYNNNKSTR